MSEERGGFAPSSREFAAEVCRVTREQWREPELPAEDRKVAEALAQLNHRTRNVYWSARRHGKSEEEALSIAWESLPR